MKKLTVVLFAVAVTSLLVGCGGKKKSATTGWNYDDPNWGGYESAKSTEQETGPGLVFIEGGSFVMGGTLDNVRFDWNNRSRKVTVSSFYMDQCEVTNHQYREYLHWLHRAYGNDYPEVVKRALPDTLVWRSKLSYAEPMVAYYFREPEYANFPVVGVSWLQAVDFCNWRTDRVNEMILIREGYLDFDPDQVGENTFNTDAYYAGLYEGLVKKEIEDLNPSGTGTRKVRSEDGILLPAYRLPTEAEWEFAALALVGNMRKDGRMLERRIYPWNGHMLRTDNKKYYGEMLANFKRSRGDNMGVAGALNDSWEYTAPVEYYFPNDYGLYNMAGNVAEWCMDVYRPVSGMDVNDLNPFRGNVYTEKVVDEDGIISEKDSLGRLYYRQVREEDNVNRLNYRKADNINFLDGDYASVLSDSESWSDEIELPEGVNGTTGVMYEYGKSSMISDKARVVKGGSWKDRAYYLAPAQRRYLDQGQSTEWIGFRCAMDRKGPRKAR